ncbi:MAG: hypothetical protein FWD17_15180, partial [Polyangiaceae bacterium]|nr:hypothetical protein [Polyangiaceae bacterium]
MPSRIDFYGLARPIQDRFAAATRRSAPPAPLLAHQTPRVTPWALLAGSVVLLVAESMLLHAGFGDVNSPLAVHGFVAVAADVVLLAGAAYCVLHAVGMLLMRETSPWRPGLYLFPACVVDAESPVLEVWPMADAEAVERLASKNLIYPCVCSRKDVESAASAPQEPGDMMRYPGTCRDRFASYAEASRVCIAPAWRFRANGAATAFVDGFHGAQACANDSDFVIARSLDG